jgi:hypothetical protein
VVVVPFVVSPPVADVVLVLVVVLPPVLPPSPEFPPVVPLVFCAAPPSPVAPVAPESPELLATSQLVSPVTAMHVVPPDPCAPVLPEFPESPEYPPLASFELVAEPPSPLFADPVPDVAPLSLLEPALPLPTAVEEPSAQVSPPEPDSTAAKAYPDEHPGSGAGSFAWAAPWPMNQRPPAIAARIKPRRNLLDMSVPFSAVEGKHVRRRQVERQFLLRAHAAGLRTDLTCGAGRS